MSDGAYDAVVDALYQVIDPELGYNIVDLGLIYRLVVVDGRVSIDITMTTPGCPAQDYIVGGVREGVGSVSGIEEVGVEVVWEPPWTPQRMSPEAKAHFGVYGGA